MNIQTKMLIRKLSVLAAALLLAQAVISQSQYTIKPDPKHPEHLMYVGIVNKYTIQNDTSFGKWFTQQAGYYHPDTAILNSFERTKAKVHFVVFGGTWCEDTQFILPKFCKILDQSGVADAAVSLYMVDRDKKTLGNLSEALNIKNVPTIIIYKDGKEIGRVVEYGSTGKWDKELSDLLNTVH